MKIKAIDSVMSARVLRKSSVAAQPTQIETPTDLHHQQTEGRIGNRSCLRQGLHADPAECGWAKQDASQHIADDLGPPGMGVEPFADEQADDQQQAEQRQRINGFWERRQEKQAFEQVFPNGAQW